MVLRMSNDTGIRVAGMRGENHIPYRSPSRTDGTRSPGPSRMGRIHLPGQRILSDCDGEFQKQKYHFHH